MCAWVCVGCNRMATKESVVRFPPMTPPPTMTILTNASTNDDGNTDDDDDNGGYKTCSTWRWRTHSLACSLARPRTHLVTPSLPPFLPPSPSLPLPPANRYTNFSCLQPVRCGDSDMAPFTASEDGDDDDPGYIPGPYPGWHICADHVDGTVLLPHRDGQCLAGAGSGAAQLRQSGVRFHVLANGTVVSGTSAAAAAAAAKGENWVAAADTLHMPW